MLVFLFFVLARCFGQDTLYDAGHFSGIGTGFQHFSKRGGSNLCVFSWGDHGDLVFWERRAKATARQARFCQWRGPPFGPPTSCDGSMNARAAAMALAARQFQGIARLALARSEARARPGRSAKRRLSRAATHCPLPRTGSRVRDLRKLRTTAPAALPVPVQVLPAVLPVQVSQAPAPESAAMTRRSPELHPEISPIRN